MYIYILVLFAHIPCHRRSQLLTCHLILCLLADFRFDLMREQFHPQTSVSNLCSNFKSSWKLLMMLNQDSLPLTDYPVTIISSLLLVMNCCSLLLFTCTFASTESQTSQWRLLTLAITRNSEIIKLYFYQATFDSPFVHLSS